MKPLTPEEISERIAIKLKHRRNQLKLTQRQAAKLSGIRNTSIHEYENNQTPISAVNLYRLSKAYKVSTDYFYKKLYDYKDNNDKPEIEVDYGKEEIYYK